MYETTSIKRDSSVEPPFTKPDPLYESKPSLETPGSNENVASFSKANPSSHVDLFTTASLQDEKSRTHDFKVYPIIAHHFVRAGRDRNRNRAKNPPLHTANHGVDDKFPERRSERLRGVPFAIPKEQGLPRIQFSTTHVCILCKIDFHAQRVVGPCASGAAIRGMSFECPTCSEAFYRTSDFGQHLELKHQELLVCEACTQKIAQDGEVQVQQAPAADGPGSKRTVLTSSLDTGHVGANIQVEGRKNLSNFKNQFSTLVGSYLDTKNYQSTYQTRLSNAEKKYKEVSTEQSSLEIAKPPGYAEWMEFLFNIGKEEILLVLRSNVQLRTSLQQIKQQQVYREHFERCIRRILLNFQVQLTKYSEDYTSRAVALEIARDTQWFLDQFYYIQPIHGLGFPSPAIKVEDGWLEISSMVEHSPYATLPKDLQAKELERDFSSIKQVKSKGKSEQREHVDAAFGNPQEESSSRLQEGNSKEKCLSLLQVYFSKNTSFQNLLEQISLYAYIVDGDTHKTENIPTDLETKLGANLTASDDSKAIKQEQGLPTIKETSKRSPVEDYEISSNVADQFFQGKKRRGRAAPPGRCHSCNRAESPEWRRGPDGSRTLCNACGLHYAKLTRKSQTLDHNPSKNAAISENSKLSPTFSSIGRQLEVQAIAAVPSGLVDIGSVSKPLDESPAASVDTTMTTPDVDSDTDDSSIQLSDCDLPNDMADDRVSNPAKYLAKLRNLEHQVFLNTRITPEVNHVSLSQEEDDRFLRRYNYPFMTSACPNFDVEVILKYVKEVKLARLLLLLECHTTMALIADSLSLLRKEGFCSSHISILVLDSDRPEVVKLSQIEVSKILSLGEAFQLFLGMLVLKLQTTEGPEGTRSLERALVMIDSGLAQEDIVAKCEDILRSLGLSPSLFFSIPQTCQYTTQILELGILSFVGAHISRFDQEHMGTKVKEFRLPTQYAYHDKELRDISSHQSLFHLVVRQRQLQCMDGFLGQARPWVLQSYSHNGDQRLYLRTSIKALSDIWGPSWKILHQKNDANIRQLDIGNGAIVRWPQDRQNASSEKPMLAEGEIFCHWIPFSDWKDEAVAQAQACLPTSTFQESDILVIGASKGFGLMINPECEATSAGLVGIKTSLQQQGALRQPNTFRSHRYLDSQAVQVQGSALGFVSAAGMLTYKRRTGQMMKDVLVERWRHGLRNPMDLEAFSGVEISLCTRNARRRRLLHILGTATMRNYLQSNDFDWAYVALEESYFQSLRSPKHFRAFWKQLSKEDRINVGDAITLCLEALKETGTDQSSRELRSLWVESFDTEGDSDGESDSGFEEIQNNPDKLEKSKSVATKKHMSFFEDWVVTLFKAEHTWTGFLKDSEESLTMSVITMTCLDLDQDGYGRRCLKLQARNSTKVHRGYPVLQTSLQINRTLLPRKDDPKEKSCKETYQSSKFKVGTKLSLGDHGSLKVLTCESRICPMVVEWRSVKSETVTEIKDILVNETILGRPNEMHHREYIRGKWDEKPVPILVMSKNNKL